MISVDIEHEYTKERATVEVTAIYQNTIHVRFIGIVGACVYELNLKMNTMRATSVAVRRKHPHCVWHAADIEAVRRMVWMHHHPDDAAVKKSMERHVATMPGQKRGVS